jgi:putative hydrolase of the HAD superfamily
MSRPLPACGSALAPSAAHPGVTKCFCDLFILCATYQLAGDVQVVKNVIFDLGGVVIDWNPDRVLERYYADPESRAFMKMAMFLHPDWLHMDRGTLSETDLLLRLGERTGRPAAELDGLFNAVRESLHAKPDTVALLERLHGRNVPLYCLSNISSGIFRHLRERHSFWGVFRGIVISGDIRMLKPEPEIFEFLLQRHGLNAAESVFIDDSAPNIESARALGLSTVWFKSARQCERELEHLLTSN